MITKITINVKDFSKEETPSTKIEVLFDSSNELDEEVNKNEALFLLNEAMAIVIRASEI